MSEEPERLTKEQWMQRVMDEGHENVVRNEMIRLGFWTEKPISKEEQEQIELEEAELKRLQSELHRLKRESAKLGDMKQLLKEARARRIEESKRRRAKRKAKRERQQKDAKQRWKEYQAIHIVHAGRGVSYDLQSVEDDQEKLIRYGLPIIQSAQELANALGISVSKLKWLTYHRNAATLSHYAWFTIPKKNGGRREISAPKPDLREAQEWIQANLLSRIPVHPCAYGFVKGRNTVENAKPHVKRAAVIKMDLKDFFPSITFHRVKGLFQSFGYSGLVSTLLALLTTEPPRKKVKFDGTVYYVAIGDRQLPQGACTSPTLTNWICRRLDERLERLAKKLGFRYTRYADDLTFSCDNQGLAKVGACLHSARAIIRSEGFEVHEKKTRVLRATRRQKVTGIVVNEKLNISRNELKNFRALLHNVEKNGLEKENRDQHSDFWGYIQGYTSYIQMVRPDLGEKFAQQVKRIGEKYGFIAHVGITE